MSGASETARRAARSRIISALRKLRDLERFGDLEPAPRGILADTRSDLHAALEALSARGRR